jgi:hypothetical protein
MIASRSRLVSIHLYRTARPAHLSRETDPLPRDGCPQCVADGENVVSYQVKDQQPTEVKVRKNDKIFVVLGDEVAATACEFVNFAAPGGEEGRGNPGQLRFRPAGQSGKRAREMQPSKLLRYVLKPTLEAREASASGGDAGPSGTHSVVASPEKKKRKDDQALKNQRRILRQDFCKAVNSLSMEEQQQAGVSWRPEQGQVVKHGLLWQPEQVCCKGTWLGGGKDSA